MKLQILIPQYNEDNSVIKNMLDSIAIQQGITFNTIEVLIGNDGSDIKLSEDFLGSYPFSIQYFEFEHTSPAGTRQALLDKATADYVMFCDADDMFLTVLGLTTIFAYMRKSFDALVCDFVEEIKDPRTGMLNYVTHSKDPRFVHGKVYRRRHLIDNKITWHPDIQYHEDSAFNLVALAVTKNVEYCKIPIYLWKWRDSSICRSDNSYILKTYPMMLKSNAYLIGDLLDRGFLDNAKIQACTLIYNTYYLLNKPAWLDPMNAKYRYETEKAFKEYYQKHKDLYDRTDPMLKSRLVPGIKRRVMGEGILFEKYTFDAWLKHIEELD